MELLFTTRIITKLESDHGKLPFTTLLNQGTLLSFREFVKAGMQLNDDNQASLEIDSYLASGKSLPDLYVEIVGRLEDGHFLDQGAKQVAMKQQAEQLEMKMALLSPKVGSEEKLNGSPTDTV